MSMPWERLPAVASRLYEELSGPSLDADELAGRDPRFIEEVGRPFCDWLRKVYFRVEFEGVEYVPRRGSFIAVANHSGGPILPDIWVMLSRFWEHFGTQAPSYALVHDAAFSVPVLRNTLIKLGALRASRHNAEKVLEIGGVLLITPGGDAEALRSFWRRNRLDLGGHSAFVELAFRYGATVLPVVNVGGHEVYWTLFSSRALAHWSGIQWWTRVKTVPVNVGLPWGIWATGFVPYLPLPSKMSFQIGKPFRFPRDPRLAQNRDAVARAFHRVGDRMQEMLDELAARRRFPVIG